MPSYHIDQSHREEEDEFMEDQGYDRKSPRAGMAQVADNQVEDIHIEEISLDSKEARVRRALVVDDSVIIRKSLDRALTKQGFQVHLATNGLEGLQELQKHVFDVIFCDFLMPVMDGCDCVQHYREWEEDHRPWFRQYIIGISAHCNGGDIEKGKEAGMDDFQAKPLPLKTIKELIESEKIKQITAQLNVILTSPEFKKQALRTPPQQAKSNQDETQEEPNTDDPEAPFPKVSPLKQQVQQLSREVENERDELEYDAENIKILEMWNQKLVQESVTKEENQRLKDEIDKLTAMRDSIDNDIDNIYNNMSKQAYQMEEERKRRREEYLASKEKEEEAKKITSFRRGSLLSFASKLSQNLQSELSRNLSSEVDTEPR